MCVAARCRLLKRPTLSAFKSRRRNETQAQIRREDTVSRTHLLCRVSFKGFCDSNYHLPLISNWEDQARGVKHDWQVNAVAAAKAGPLDGGIVCCRTDDETWHGHRPDD